MGSHNWLVLHALSKSDEKRQGPTGLGAKKITEGELVAADRGHRPGAARDDRDLVLQTHGCPPGVGHLAACQRSANRGTGPSHGAGLRELDRVAPADIALLDNRGVDPHVHPVVLCGRAEDAGGAREVAVREHRGSRLRPMRILERAAPGEPEDSPRPLSRHR